MRRASNTPMVKRVKIKDETPGTFPSISSSFESGTVPPDSHDKAPTIPPNPTTERHAERATVVTRIPRRMQNPSADNATLKGSIADIPDEGLTQKSPVAPEVQTGRNRSASESVLGPAPEIRAGAEVTRVRAQNADSCSDTRARPNAQKASMVAGESRSGHRKFDLNIEEVLEDWEVHHAIREIIANAIDEHVLTGTEDIKIRMEGDRLIVRDFGRGIRYEHLTQNENKEKIFSENQIIGKFGVGLKDALATFDRHRIGVMIRSRHGDITIDRSSKHEFEDIVTLHAVVLPPSQPQMDGTEVVLTGCSNQDVDTAKELFLRFSGERRLDSTRYGEILETRRDTPSRIYINGVRVAEEDNFLFSYNITSLTNTMKKALNRERTHVGRSAYAGRVKAILLSSSNEEVAHSVAEDLKDYGAGTQHEELKWGDVSAHACKILNASNEVVFATPDELQRNVDMVDRAKRDGLSVVVVPAATSQKIHGGVDILGKTVRDMSQFVTEYSESFVFKFVKPEELGSRERAIYDRTGAILELIGGRPEDVREILISETMREEGSGADAGGLWEYSTGRIIIKRAELGSMESYAGTLLHEAAHASSGASDSTRDFENELTSIIGKVSAKCV